MYATRHNVQANRIRAFNKTQDKYIYCDLANSFEKTRVELITGLEKDSTDIMIKCNFPNPANQKDVIILLNKKYVVTSISEKETSGENAKYCTNLSKLPSTTYLMLKCVG
jgi:hypothetical protein